MRALLRDPAAEVRGAALGAVCAIEQEAALPTVLPFLDVRTAPEAVVRAAAAVALIRHAGIDGVLAAAEPLKQLLGAGDPRDRAAAADALGRIGVGGFFRPLLAFLRDPDLIVRRAAIAASGKLRASELVAALVEQFQRRETALEAVSALAAFGPGIEGALEAILLDEASQVDCRRGVALVLQRHTCRAPRPNCLGWRCSRSATRACCRRWSSSRCCCHGCGSTWWPRTCAPNPGRRAGTPSRCWTTRCRSRGSVR